MTNTPIFWLTLGDAALESQRAAEAVNAYWQATRRDSNNIAAWDRLRIAMLRLRNSESEFSQTISDEQLSTVTEHAASLLDFGERFNDFAGGGKVSQTLAEQVARSLMRLGRLWEAEAWSAIATTLNADPSNELAELRQQILARLRSQPGWIADDIPAMKLSLSFLPEPKLNLDGSSSKRNVIPRLASHEHLQLSETVGRLGLA